MKTTNDVYDRVNKIIIVPSTTWLYYQQEKHNDEHVKLVYYPYNINLAAELKILRDALTGDERAKQSTVYQDTLVRFGWIDKGLNDLKWIPLPELVDHPILD